MIFTTLQLDNRHVKLSGHTSVVNTVELPVETNLLDVEIDLSENPVQLKNIGIFYISQLIE